jgi:hypothetical protein
MFVIMAVATDTRPVIGAASGALAYQLVRGEPTPAPTRGG